MDADTITISGRDRAGRLVDESMELIAFKGLGLQELAQKIVGPWFSRIDLSNATNRALVMGKARGAKGGRAYKEPNIPRSARAYRKVEPGETRWGVLEYFLREMELLAWPSADGKALIIGKPNYDQEPTFKFFHPRAGSRRAAEGNCVSFSLRQSVGERYSQVIAVGANAGGIVNYGEKTVKRRGVASNGPGLYGIGADFTHRKVLLLSDDAVKDDAQALVRAARELAERDAQGYEITVQVAGHAQEVAGGRAPTLYACDTMAHVESEVFGVRGLFLVTSVRFKRDRQQGEVTEIRLVPKGTALKA
jgi:prophage tail gpP-like protein